MQLNLGLFAFNGACGYLEKPSVLRLSRDSFDPKTQTSIENVAALQMSITLLSGQFLCQDREPTIVEMKMFGIEADGSKRHEGRARIKEWNGFQAIYDDINHVTIRFSRVTNERTTD
jgi:phosphatidylinositol phospholipase C, beta